MSTFFSRMPTFSRTGTLSTFYTLRLFYFAFPLAKFRFVTAETGYLGVFMYTFDNDRYLIYIISVRIFVLVQQMQDLLDDS